MLVFNFYYFESLVGAKGDEEKMEDKLPRESPETDILLKGAEGDFLDEVHLDHTFFILFHPNYFIRPFRSKILIINVSASY